MILMILKAVLWLLCVPFCMGMLTTRLLPTKKQTYGMIMINGYVVSVALFQCLYLAFVLAGSNSAKWLAVVFAIVSVVYAALSAVLGRSCIVQCEKNRRESKFSVFTIIFLLLVAGQLVLRLLQQVSDGDDAFFVASANVSAQSVYMNYIQPYTGGYTLKLDIRHAFSGIQIWIASLSRLTGIHAAIMAHCVLGIVVLLLHYGIVFEIGRSLFHEKKDAVGLFSFLAALINVFGNVSLYTPQTFLLTRTWQGKTILANLAVPLMFLLLIELYNCRKRGEKVHGIYILSAMIFVFALACATTGIVLMVVLGISLIIIGFTKPSEATGKKAEVE